MKLWQKAAAVCAGVLSLVVAVCSAVTLLYARTVILDMARDQVRTKQRDLTVSFSEMANYYLLDTDSQAVRDSLILYSFDKFADDTAVLKRGAETLSTALAFDPAKYMDLPDSREIPIWEQEEELFEGRVWGRDVLMAAEPVLVRGEEYAVYTVADVTDIHHSLGVMALIFLGVSLTGILAGAGAVTALMRRGARPLADLSAAARRIAGGEYAVRADVTAKDEIGLLAADFNTMAEAVQRHVAELSERAERERLFVAGATHEFKTPLTAILLHTRLLRRANLTPAERAESLAHIEGQCIWLENLRQKLLQLLTLGRDIARVPIGVSELLERVRSATAELMAERRCILETDSDGGELYVDPDLMQSLLMNLVDNAGKAYGPEDKDRTVYLTARSGVLEVRDTGRGIPPEALGRIFEPFYMADKSRSRKTGGSGLGLALVKEIADAHGARIEVQSAPGQGTTVRVILPEGE